jgi:hypothetical protein
VASKYHVHKIILRKSQLARNASNGPKDKQKNENKDMKGKECGSKERNLRNCKVTSQNRSTTGNNLVVTLFKEEKKKESIE